MTRLHMRKSAIKPLVQINVYGSQETGEVSSVNFSRNTNWHSQSLLYRMDILGDVIAQLEVLNEKLLKQYHDSKQR